MKLLCESFFKKKKFAKITFMSSYCVAEIIVKRFKAIYTNYILKKKKIFLKESRKQKTEKLPFPFIFEDHDHQNTNKFKEAPSNCSDFAVTPLTISTRSPAKESCTLRTTAR